MRSTWTWATCGKWLKGTIGATGGQVDYVSQNGYILYFSDRRGMLPDPLFVSGRPILSKAVRIRGRDQQQLFKQRHA